MGIRRFQPTPREEFIGRAALVVSGLAAVVTGIRLTCLLVKLMIAVGESDASPAAEIVLPLIMPALFLVLAGGAAVAFAFIPTVDKGWGPPRGFATLSKVLDMFWGAVATVFDAM
ncbi:MAG: hypothetical protein JWO31_2195 [Phycisphaerales bacterium]|nr:hypothetical protein [Phycisphaerales bacterium]